MKQAVMTAPGNIEFREIPMPTIRDGQILAKIMRIGICGSDIHVYHGTHPYTSYPVVQGHEISAQVVAIGLEVNDLKPGDMITIMPQVTCGKCYSCTHGNYHICDELKVMGFQTTGMASEYVAVDAFKVIKLPATVSYDQGALVEPLSVAVHALNKAGDIRGKKIVVLGAGPIGNLVAQAAKGMGADVVMVTDMSDYRLNIAKQCQVDYAINPAHQDLAEEILDKFGPSRADVIFECVGNNAAVKQAIECARKGTDIIIVGVFTRKPEVDLGLVQDHELRLIGSLMYQQNDYIEAINLIASNKIDLKPLITTHFAFIDYLCAYKYIEEQKDMVMKVLINVSEEG